MSRKNGTTGAKNLGVKNLDKITETVGIHREKGLRPETRERAQEVEGKPVAQGALEATQRSQALKQEAVTPPTILRTQ